MSGKHYWYAPVPIAILRAVAGGLHGEYTAAAVRPSAYLFSASAVKFAILGAIKAAIGGVWPAHQLARTYGGDKILQELAAILASEEFQSSRQLSRFLEYAFGHALSNRLDELKETIIGIEVFERGDDFDPKADGIVRVQATKLRKRLASFYANRSDTPAVIIGMPPGSYVPVFRRPGLAPRGGNRVQKAVLGAIGCVIVAMALVWWFRVPAAPEWTVRQLTFDTRSSRFPAISRDGRFVVFASNRADAGNTDLFLHPLDGSPPGRLTTNSALDTHPDISPNGEDVVFRSYRNPAGVYIVNIRTRAERLVAAGGFSPRFSPDGRWIAYSCTTGRGTSSVFVVPVTGGPARDIVPGANSARGPLWTPDGEHVLYIDSVPGHSSEYDWWAVRTDSASRAPIRTGIRELLATQQLPPLTASAFPLTWHRGRVVFTLKSRKEAELWSVALADGTLRADGRAAQLFPGPGLTDARATGDDAATLVFARDEDANQLWAIPVSCGVRAGGAISSRTTNR